MTAARLEAALTRYWGYTSFRPLQREAMETVLAGRDCIARHELSSTQNTHKISTDCGNQTSLSNRFCRGIAGVD